MTVSSTTTRNSYTGDGSTTVFAYTFKIFDDDDITVILRTTATGTETVQTKTTDYSVSGVGSAGGGNITFVTAPTAAQTVVLLRQTAQTQTTDYTPNDPFPAASHEDALDKMTLIIQDQQDELDRAIKLSRTNTMTSTEFTVGASDRANKILAFDSSGELAVTQEIGTFTGDWASGTSYQQRDIIKDTSNDNIYIANTAHTSSGSEPISSNTDSAKWDLLVDAAAAATSATAAASSATAAAASATAAAASESAAATSETNAATSETNAATSESNASTSATNAATSATAAAASETAAAASETAAAASETAAAASETAAAASETAAAASESAAATSETNAATSETNAATSETNAATSETNAATSATNAATSATAASTAQTAAEAARDAIQQFYLGAQTSNPTVDGNGDPVTDGDWYFNTTDNTTRIYDGSAWNTVAPDLVGDATPQLGGDLDTNGNDINFGDNDKAVFGAGSDLQIYHSGSASFIDDVGTGNLNLRADAAIAFQNSTGTEEFARFISNGAVQLNYDDSIKLATTSGGIDVTGTITFDGGTTSADLNFGDNDKAVFGTGSDLKIYHDGSNSYVQEGGTGSLYLLGQSQVVIGKSDATATYAAFNNTGSVDLYFNNAKKLATTSSGIDVTGTAVTDGLTVAGNVSVDGGTIKLDGDYPTGSQNVALGNTALDSLTSGNYNTAIGSSALTANNGNSNVAVGAFAGDSISGSSNTIIGTQAMQDATSGDSNVAVGFDALGSSTTASNNTALGRSALQANTTASNNTAVGYQSLYANTTGTRNTTLGYVAGSSNTTNSYNTFIGAYAGELCTGAQNTFIGDNCGDLVTTGAKNTILGRYNGNQGGLDIRTSSNNIVLSDGDGNPRGYYQNAQSMWYFGNQTSGIYWPQDTSTSGRNAVGISPTYGYLSATTNSTYALALNRNNSDGTLVRFLSTGTEEGSISVSGTTVSYNGGHLARWSRLADDSKDTSIVKGTVMTNLDEMVEWGDEDNEQLNKMAVSSVEGDANVAGVFVNWDSDDDWNDMNVAMTGDMVIRIAQGTTVARGDLLMSAGDGTAKPQGDDIVRSKTIAKVTSTHVSHTYDDGSYLVPCVLMAC